MVINFIMILSGTMSDSPVIRAVKFEGSKEEQSSVTCSAVEFEPKPLGPAVPAKYLSVAFMDCPASESHKEKSIFVWN